jgi:type 1 glutamine amidotransferase
MKSYLEESGLFTADVERTKYTWNGKKFVNDYKIPGVQETEDLDKSKHDPDFSPDFKKYDLVIVNFGWNAAPWTAETQKNFEKFVKKGGGVVIIHAADNSFPEWTAYNEMIGLGGWGDRTEKDGPYVYFDKEGKLQHDMTPGRGGSHGPPHEFQIQVRDTEHPITKGMPTLWLHSIDELYDRLRGPAKNMKILATTYSAPEKRGTDRHEPILITIDYGKGRIFHTPMGHIDKSFECVGLITSFLRGSQWAATGKVTIPIPADFPTENKTSIRKFD